MIDTWNPAYLRHGSPRQRAAYRALKAARIFSDLAAYRPFLAGTIPLGLDLPTSDLDILCQAEDLAAFAGQAQQLYAAYPDFTHKTKNLEGEPSLIVRFTCAGFAFELVAQRRAVELQRAYRHLQVQARLLALGGEAARQGILALRQAGLKTEPAFGAYFELPGDPYQALLDLAACEPARLARQVVEMGGVIPGA